MELTTLLFLALGLSMDAFAVSLSNAMCYGDANKKQTVYTAFTFGLFQAGMPVIGYFAGRFFYPAISFLDHWIAFALLGFIGGNMLFTTISELKNPQECPVQKAFSLRLLLFQAFATSIDALAVGIGFAVMQTNILYAAGLIGVVTFICCLFGASLGKKFGSLLEQKAKIFGGAILILIGLKILLEHTLFA